MPMPPPPPPPPRLPPLPRHRRAPVKSSSGRDPTDLIGRFNHSIFVILAVIDSSVHSCVDDRWARSVASSSESYFGRIHGSSPDWPSKNLAIVPKTSKMKESFLGLDFFKNPPLLPASMITKRNAEIVEILFVVRHEESVKNHKIIPMES